MGKTIEEVQKENAALMAQLAELTAASAPQEKRELTKEEKALVAEGCKAWGIAEKYVLSSNVREENGEKIAVIVTHGGAKVLFSKRLAADKERPIVPLEAARVDGIIRKKMKPVGAK